jgi:adenine phosphoribosyltransferase
LKVSAEKLLSAMRTIPDFPKPGINFIDITPVLLDKDLFAESVELLCKRYINSPPAAVAGTESRGFIFGAAMARRLNCGFVPIRKKGKLPWEKIEESYSLEYGAATIEIHRDAVKPGERIVMVDDLLATGGTMAAAVKLVERLGGKIAGIEFLVELAFLDGRKALKNYPVNSIVNVK